MCCPIVLPVNSNSSVANCLGGMVIEASCTVSLFLCDSRCEFGCAGGLSQASGHVSLSVCVLAVCVCWWYVCVCVYLPCVYESVLHIGV